MKQTYKKLYIDILFVYFRGKMNRILGYILAVLGLVVFALGIPPVNEIAIEYIPGLESISGNILFLIGVAALVLGIFVLRFSPSGGRQAKEVPIYHGKQVVGYRRTGK